MALTGRLETTVELKSSAEAFYNVWRETPFDVPNHSPSHIQAVEHHDGDWETHGHGSVKTWNYISEGKAEFYKEKVEYDDANMTVTLIGVDGHPMKLYKTYNCTFKVTPKDTGSLVTLIIDYEKASPEVRDPLMYMDLIVGFTKDIDAALAKP